MHKVSDETFCLRRSKEENDVIDHGVPCFITEDSQNGDAAQPEHHEAMIASEFPEVSADIHVMEYIINI